MLLKIEFLLGPFLLLFILALTHIDNAKSQSDNISYTTFTNDTIGVSFEYPENWSIMEFPMLSKDDFHLVRVGSPDGKSEILIQIYLTDNPPETIQQNLALAISFATRDGFEYNKTSDLSTTPFHTILDTWKLSTNKSSESEQGKYYFGNDQARAFEIYYMDKKKNYDANASVLTHIKDSLKLSEIESFELQFLNIASSSL
jgi:hypothetical protein